MNPTATVNPAPADQTEEDIDLYKIGLILNSIASAAASNDLYCFHAHADLQIQGANTDLVGIELDRMRDLIKRFGWLADLCNKRLGSCGSLVVCGENAEEWLLAPAERVTGV